MTVIMLFATEGPAKPFLTPNDLAEIREEVRQWRSFYRPVKERMLEVTSQDLCIRVA